MEKLINETKEKMKKSVESLKGEFNTIRTGRANTSILDRVRVDYYGAKTPLSHMSSISIPDSRQIIVKPFEKDHLKDVEKAIVEENLGFNPVNDGDVIRINIPPLTEERRKEFVKVVKKISEEAKISIRNIRRDSNSKVKKNDDISEDFQRDLENQIQELTNEFIDKVDDLSSKKEKEIMEV